MTDTHRLEQWAEAVAAASPVLDPDDRRIALQTYHLLARGEPAAPAQIAEAAGVTAERAEESLRAWPLVLWDEEDRVVGFWGLHVHRLEPTHGMEVDGATVYGWCAWDTLFITELLGQEVRVESTDPHEGTSIRLTVTPDGVIELDPLEAVVSLLLPEGGFGPDTIQRFCHRIHFFASPRSARECIAERPGLFTITVDEAFELGRLTNRLRLGATPDGSETSSTPGS